MALISRQLNPNRSFAVDLFRGFTMAAMVLVTSPGGPQSYRQLEHAEWNGWTFTDLIFPAFAFIIGVSLMYSLAARQAGKGWKGLSLFDWITPILLVIKLLIKLATQTGMLRHAPDPPLGGYDVFIVALIVLLIALPRIERRNAETGGSRALEVVHHGVLLFALGFTWTFDAVNPAGFRVFAVLQRLGIVYLFTGLIILHWRRAGQIAWLVGLLVVYTVLMKLVPVPGFGAGVLTMEGNFAGYVDRLILGGAHMYQPRPSPYFDPEGILGSLPAIATGLLGAIAGGWMRETESIKRRMTGLTIVGVCLFLAGLLLDAWFPINKNLWSPSYVLLNAGIDAVALSACLWCVDFKHARKTFSPFIVMGSNSILIYLLSGTVLRYAGAIPGGTMNGVELDGRQGVYQHAFASWLDPRNASLAMALAYVAIWILIAAELYRRRIFVKL